MATWKEREEVLLESLGYRYTPLTSDNSDYFALSLIDRGIAETRALRIAEALRNDDWDAVASAILHCDGSNFPRLFQHIATSEPSIDENSLVKANSLFTLEINFSWLR